MLNPYHKVGDKLMTFDYIVSNPPFNLDFSDYRTDLDSKQNKERFFAGIPNIPKKDKNSMAIYQLFIQHIMFSLSAKGKAAIVVPTGFVTAQTGIPKKIRERLVESRMLRGVISMPSNIFATTGTNVSILFIDKANTKGDIVLMDASKLGTTVKDGKNQKTLLSHDEEQLIIETFNKHETKENFTVVVSYEQIKERNYSFSAGQYFDVKIEYTEISAEEFKNKMETHKRNLDSLFADSKILEAEIKRQLGGLKYE
jgi:type I restriction enzyme M protein